MRFGVVCLLDALGIKDVWREKKRGKGVLATLKGAFDVARGMKVYLNGSLAPALNSKSKVRVLAFSDTILIAAQGGFSGSDAVPLDMVCEVAANVLRYAAQADFPLVFRGVVTAGDFVLQETRMIGPAVDEGFHLA